MKMKVFIGVVIAIVTASVVWGLYVIGSPEKTRLRKFDDIRLQHLQQIQSELLSYWQSKDVLPAQLDMLRDDLTGVTVPKDPQTGAPYEYRKTGELTFTLCANFALSTDERKLNDKDLSYPMYGPYGPYIIEQTWEHGVGRQCFDRTIDKERYQKDQEQVKRNAPVY